MHKTDKFHILYFIITENMKIFKNALQWFVYLKYLNIYYKSIILLKTNSLIIIFRIQNYFYKLYLKIQECWFFSYDYTIIKILNIKKD